MKIKTSEATPLQLNYLVAVCEGKGNDCEIHADPFIVWYGRVTTGFIQYRPSTDWAQGGPIIERKRIVLVTTESGELWDAKLAGAGNEYYRGPTALIAAMRCCVASELGDEVEVPSSLK